MPALPAVSWELGKKNLKGGTPGHCTEVLGVIALRVNLCPEVQVTVYEGAAHVTETAEVYPLKEKRRTWFQAGSLKMCSSGFRLK